MVLVLLNVLECVLSTKILYMIYLGTYSMDT